MIQLTEIVGGKAKPRFGGGQIIEPAKFYLGDRAVDEFNGKSLQLAPHVLKSVQEWLAINLRFLRVGENLTFFNEIRPSSASLNQVEEGRLSNDTSVGVGSWPPTELECLVRELETFLNSPELKKRHPEAGEDIKIMAVRSGREVKLTCAIAMVDRFVSSVSDYLNKKSALVAEIKSFLTSRKSNLTFEVAINTLDVPERGEDGLHLTVTGLSCENGDSGEVGRGNRINGLISFLRPQTMEAWAGKNPVTHVGKIYSAAASMIAKRICETFPEISEANVFLIGKIGSPVETPENIFCQLAVTQNCREKFENTRIETFVRQEIESRTLFQIQNIMKPQ